MNDTQLAEMQLTPFLLPELAGERERERERTIRGEEQKPAKTRNRIAGFLTMELPIIVECQMLQEAGNLCSC